MKTRSEVLRIAESHLGDGGAVFRKFAGLPAGASYCNAYVDYVAKEGGVASLYFDGRKETYCPHSIEWCKKNLAQVPLYWALPVDIIYFDWEPNGRPNHIGLVREKKSATVIYTVEGNTDKKNKDGKVVAHNVVANRTRNGSYVQGVFHVLYVPLNAKKKELDLDGDFGPQTIYNLQLALGMKATGVFTKETAKTLQRKVGATADAAIGPATARKLQKFLGVKQDGEIGPSTTKALQKWVNKVNYPSTQKSAPETTRAVPAAKSAAKKKTVTRSSYNGEIAKPTLKRGSKGAEVKKLQKFFEWYFPNVKFKKYGTFGPHTEKVQKAYQKAEKLSRTGVYGTSSYKKALRYKKKNVNAEKLLKKMDELAWAYGTAKKKYKYKTGAPKSVCKAAMKKYGWADSKAELSDCGNFLSTVVRETGVNKSFKALHGTKRPFPTSEKGFTMVHKGKKIPDGLLKPADVIRYKKKNGNQHAMFYYGNGKVCEASHYSVFGVIRKDTKRYNKQSKTSTIQVLRAKE